MRLRTSATSPAAPFFSLLSLIRLLSSSSSDLRNLPNLPIHKRTRALADAKLSLTEYLHSTRALPISLADQIASNSPVSLRSFVSSIPFLDAPPSDFRRIVHGFLSYHPVNELSFFFESIGIHPSHPSFPSGNPFFLSDDEFLIAAVSSLLHFGFPWSSLGPLYIHSPSIFSSPSGRLLNHLRRLEGLGFPRPCVIAVCLTFPSVLRDAENDELLLRDFVTVFVDWDIAGCAGHDVDSFLRFCRMIRVLYGFGWEKGGVGELGGCGRRIFVELDEFSLAQKLNFFVKLGMGMEEVGLFTRNNPVVFDIDLDNAEIVIPEYLIRVGLSNEEADALIKRHPYVMGKNKLGSLPGIVKALNLDKWFLAKVVGEKNLHFLSSSYTRISSYDSKLETEFLQDLERIKTLKPLQFIGFKVDFFLSIGFGRNKITSKAIGLVRGSKEPFQQRFDCLIGLGIEHSMLCRMIIAAPKLLNQCEDVLLEKVNYLSKDIGCPLEYLNSFPNFLCYDLENRVKPRYRILNWLRDIGLINKPLVPSSVITHSENRFILILLNIHPAALKQWLEQFSSHKGHTVNEETI